MRTLKQLTTFNYTQHPVLQAWEIMQEKDQASASVQFASVHSARIRLAPSGTKIPYLSELSESCGRGHNDRV